ncbi:MAG: AAA family ATPase [Sphingorhabdus sp.]
MKQLLGHDRNLEKLRFALSNGKLHHGLILAGPRGIGKATFARIAAAMIVDGDGAHRQLTQNGTHPDIVTISRPPKEPPKAGEAPDPKAELKRSINVEQVRRLQAMLTKRPTISQKRVIIVDSADDFETSASNALLKSLEEPPEGCHFLLISHASDTLLPTIRSRCQIMRFEPLGQDDMRAVLADIVSGSSPEDINMLARIGGGAPGMAAEFAGLDIVDLETKMESIIASGDPDNAIRFSLASKLALKAAQPRYEAFLRRVPAHIAEFAREKSADLAIPAVNAWQEANELSARAIALSLDKNAVILQMGSLLAGLNGHKQPSR